MADSSVQLETAALSDISEDEQVEDEHVEKSDSQVNGVMVLTLLDKIIGAVDQIQQTQNSLEHRQQEMESSVTGIQSELTKLTKSHTTTSNTVNKMLEKVRKVSINVKTVRQNLEKQAGQIKRLETNEAELLKRRNFKVMIYQDLHAEFLKDCSGNIGSNASIATTPDHPTDPASQAPSELKSGHLQLTPRGVIGTLTPLQQNGKAGCYLQNRAANVVTGTTTLTSLFNVVSTDEVKVPSKVSVSKSLKDLERVAEEGEEESQRGKDHEHGDEEQEQLQLSSDEEVEIEEIIEEMVNTERKEKIKTSREKMKKSFTPDHTVYARSKTTIYRVPPFTFHVKKIRDGEVEEVMSTEMVEVGEDEGEETTELLMEEHNPEVQALLELAEETDAFMAEKRDRDRDSD
ncbi:CAVN1 protein, partial [Polyodon spathula]|nr:CAVN1 protein [Polyodon spathula]